MRILVPSHRLIVHLIISAIAVIVPASTLAQSGQTPGTIEGRVYNAQADRFLNRAVVTAEPSGVTTLSDEYGHYRLRNVPAGAATVRVTYTGLPEIVEPVSVPAGEITRKDFTFRSSAAGDVVQLEQFVVSTGRETDGAAIALNEQRYAANIKNVVSTSEVGEIPDANVGEFVKLIPGVTLANGQIQMRGFPPSATEVYTDGNPVASAAQSGETRTVILDHLILNNVSRVEVTKVPTPDQPASSIGGKVNLVSKSAFERTRPEFSYRAFLSWTNEDSITFGKTPGPIRPTTKLRPSADFSWIVPVSDRFGFSATYTHMEQSQPQGLSTVEWVPVSGRSGSQTVAPADNPYLRQYNTRSSARITKRDSLGLTFDFRLTPESVLSFGAWYTTRKLDGEFHDVRVAVGNQVVSWGPDFVNGAAGMGSIQNVWTQNSTKGQTIQPSLSYRYNGRDWRIETALSYSRATDEIPTIEEKGTFNSGSAQISNLTVNVSEIDDGSAVVSAFAANGTPVDFYTLNNYRLTSVSENPRESFDEVANLRASAQRQVIVGIPLDVRFGLDVRRNVRDIEKRGSRSWNYLGPDGRANTGDESAGLILDESFSTKVPPTGSFDRLVEYPSASEAYALYAANPGYFALSNALTPYRNEVNASKRIEETISAGYVRLDAHFLDNRLWFVGGVRYERTAMDGLGPLIDISRAPASVTDPVERDRYIYVKRGTRVKTDYDDFFPSFSAKYDLSDKLVLRAGYATTIARPNFSSILPGINLPDPASTARTITLSNPNLKPWKADNYDVSLDYYFTKVGSLGLTAFRKDIDDFFGQTSFPSDPVLLAAYGVDPAVYGADQGYIMTTNVNAGSARISGLELNYRQKLDFDFLPAWTRAIEVFGSFTRNRLEGDASANFSQFSPRTYTMGLNIRQKRFSLSASMVSQGTKRMSPFTGAGTPAGTYNYQSDPQTYNLSGDFVLTKNLSLFASALNVGARAPIQLRYSDDTPSYARFRNLGDALYCLVTVGVKGKF